MNSIILNGEKMITSELCHIYLAEKLDLSEEYASNLDGLWNELMAISEPTSIQIVNTEDLLDNLSDYGDELLQVFEDACSENPDLDITID